MRPEWHAVRRKARRAMRRGLSARALFPRRMRDFPERLRSAGLAVLCIGPDGCITYANDSFLRCTGHSFPDISGRHYSCVVDVPVLEDMDFLRPDAANAHTGAGEAGDGERAGTHPADPQGQGDVLVLRHLAADDRRRAGRHLPCLSRVRRTGPNAVRTGVDDPGLTAIS
jgi:PAS domain-containing protein